MDKYAWRVVDNTDLKTLCQFAAQSIVHDFEGEIHIFDDEYVIEIIKDYYPDFFDK